MLIITHWSFCWLQHVDVYNYVDDDILMGVFGPNGVNEVAQDIVEQLNGIPVGRIGKLAVYIVSTATAPNNKWPLVTWEVCMLCVHYTLYAAEGFDHMTVVIHSYIDVRRVQWLSIHNFIPKHCK